MKNKTVVYPGSFDPFTLGHLNVVERAVKVFDRVIVAVAEDVPKTHLFSIKERIEIIREIFHGNEGVQVESFKGLLVNYLRDRKYHLLLRGIRTVSDFEYEYQMALGNKTLAEDVETFFMMTEGKFSYLSSTIIKEVARLGGDVKEMVPPEVAQRIRRIYGNPK